MGFAKVPHELRKRLHELTGSQLKVWLCHLLHEDKNHTSYPSVPLIAKETGLDADTVGDAHKWLRENGWLKTIGSRDSKTGKFAVPVGTCAIPEGVKPRHGKTPSRESTVTVPTVDGSTMDGKYPPEVDTFGVDTFEADTNPQGDTKVKGLVSELVSEVRSVAPLPHTRVSENTNTFDQAKKAMAEPAMVEETPKPRWTEADVDREVGPGQLWTSAEDVYHSMFPSKTWTDADIELLILLAKEVGGIRGITYGGERVKSAWEWNQVHKKGKPKLLLFSIAELANALRSTNDRSLLAQMDADGGCPLCTPEGEAS